MEESQPFELPIADLEYVRELYPRIREDDAAIERYRDALDRLPPIAVARGRVLVDGFHRWQAHKREGRETIAAFDLGNLTDAEILREAIARNSAHGQQLTQKEKQRNATSLWPRFTHLNIADRVHELAQLLSVSDKTVHNWTKEARAEEKRQQQERAWDLWLDCKSTREIGEAVGVDHDTVATWLSDLGKLSQFRQPPESRQHFDVWQFGKAGDDAGAPSYPGRMPAQIVENLLWLYTEPGQIVFDPFAGGGTTIDVAKAMGRRVWASDLHPSTPNLPIHEHNIATDGWPKDAPARVDFILLDPPYWKQAAGKYSQDALDLGNMDIEQFGAAWQTTIAACVPHLRHGGLLAFVISPSVAGDQVIDHAFHMYHACLGAGLHQHRRIIATYQTQQATGQQVTWARENRQLLKLYRDVVVMMGERANGQ